MYKRVVLLIMALVLPLSAGAETPPPLPEYHLTARPWHPLEITKNDYLDTVESICRAMAAFQDNKGSIIDPYLNTEHQYATPYFAFGAGVLLHAGRDTYREAGINAMEHATACVGKGMRAIPDGHGEFFLSPLAGALELYAGHVPAATLDKWRQRLSGPVKELLQDGGSKINNWRTYGMKGEWSRHKAGLVSHETALAFVEDGWHRKTQKERILADKWSLYQDWSSNPQSHAVEAVGRGNLLGLLAGGYDGPSAASMHQAVNRGTETTLLLQDPTGQCPPNGRTDNHVFNDTLYQLCFDVMAERAAKVGEDWKAGQYRRAANLAFASIQRWKRDDGAFYVTKNHFDPADRVGYQRASAYTNYNGAVLYHLAEAWLTRQSEIQPCPAPTEIGGYAIAMDRRFGSAVLNAGGMQCLINLRGDVVPKYGDFWTPLGGVRFSRTGWDSRLGPSDGVYDAKAKRGITFGPTWKPGRSWVRLADMAEHYAGTLQVDFVHPLLVRASVLYHTLDGTGGPVFRQEYIVTPDGILTTLIPLQRGDFGVTIPLLLDDGKKLKTTVKAHRLTTAYGKRKERQHFLVLSPECKIEEDGDALQSTYGWLKPYRVSGSKESIAIFVYPQGETDPEGDEVFKSFKLQEHGFESAVGIVKENLYTGRYAAGGYGDSLDLDGDGQPEITFDKPCGFMVQHDGKTITAVEADQSIAAEIMGKQYSLEKFKPLQF